MKIIDYLAEGLKKEIEEMGWERVRVRKHEIPDFGELGLSITGRYKKTKDGWSERYGTQIMVPRMITIKQLESVVSQTVDHFKKTTKTYL